MPAFWERHRFLVVFAAMSSLMGVSVGMARVTTSLYALELCTPATVLGLIAGAQSVGTLVMSLPIGFVVDRLGPRPLFVLGTLLAGVTYLVLPLVPSPLFLLLCTAAISFFMPLRFVPLNAVFMKQLEIVGEARAGWYRGTHMAGMVLIGPTVAASAARFLGFRGAYWLIGLLFGLTLIVSPIVFGRYTLPRSGPRRRFAPGEAVAQVLALGRDPEVRSVCLYDFWLQGANAFYGFFIVVIAIQSLHADALTASQLVGVQGGSFILALFLLGGVVSRLGHERVYPASCAVVAGSLTLLGLGPGLPWLMVGGLVLGVGMGLLQIANLTRFARLGARLGRGRVSGLDFFFGPLGGLAGSVLGGALGNYVGLQRVFLAFAPVFALLAWRGALRPSAAVAPTSAPGASVEESA